MSERLDWNAKTVAEFRANEGRVGGNFEGAPMVWSADSIGGVQEASKGKLTAGSV